MNKIGKYGREWAKARAKLKATYGIEYCEARFVNCTVSIELGFAHLHRRRHLGKWGTDEREINLHTCILVCNNCHDFLDVKLGEVEGGKEIQRLINNRRGRNFWEDEQREHWAEIRETGGTEGDEQG